MSGDMDALVDLLYDLTRELALPWRAVFRQEGLPPATILLLKEVIKEPGLTVSELARRAGMAKSHSSRVLNTLFDQGLLEKRPDPSDQRAVRVYPTKDALSCLENLRDKVRGNLTELVRGVPEEEREEFAQGIRKLKEFLSGAKGAFKTDASGGDS